MTKKLLFSGIVTSLLLCNATILNASNPTVYECSGITVIPTEYTNGHKPMVYASTDVSQGESDGVEFRVFDENFSEIKRFVVTLPSQENTLPEFNILTPGGCYDGGIIIVQNFFTSSDDFCYLIADFGTIEDDYGYETVIKGFKVMNDKNNEVTKLTFPEGYFQRTWSGDGGMVNLLTMNGKNYAIIEVENDVNSYEEEYCYSLVYSLDNNTSLPSLLAITPSTRVSPRTPMRGERVTVKLGENASQSGCVVKVVATSGQTVMRTEVPAGESTVGIDTSRFQKGMYVVTVSDGVSSTETAKIIIR